MSTTRHLLKRSVLFALDHAGVNYALRVWQRQQLLIPCYHAVVSDDCARDPFGYGSVIGVTEFTRHIEMLLRMFQPVSTAQVIEARRGGRPLPPNAALITFDDGYRNNLTHAAPILLRFGAPAVFHVTTGYLGTNRILWPNEIYRRVLLWQEEDVPLPDDGRSIRAQSMAQRRHLAVRIREYTKTLPNEQMKQYLARLREAPAPELGLPEREMLEFLSWNEARKLHQMGFTLGSHTVEHPILSQVSAAQLARELSASKQRIERETGECDCFAFPNGSAPDFTPATVEAVRDCGYRLSFTSLAGLNSPLSDPMSLRRVSISSNLSKSEFRTRLTGLHGRIQGLRRRPSHRRALETSRDVVPSTEVEGTVRAA